jgi:hypothetical protein
MDYRMNVGNELAQIKNCKTIDEIKKFLEDHNLKFDHWYLDTSTSENTDTKGLYVVAYYQDIDGVFIQISFNF